MLDTMPRSITELVKGKGFTYNFDLNLIESVMELLIGKRHIFIDALLGKATLPWVPPIRIPEYFTGLMELLGLSTGEKRSSFLILTTRIRDDDNTFKGCCEFCISAIPKSN